MEIPITRIEDKTEAIFWNLIAYKEHAHSKDVKYVHDYMTLMEGLINSPKDVEFLCHKSIIDSLPGNDEAISTIFSKMGNDVFMSSKFYYRGIVNDLNNYYERKRHGYIMMLRRNHCSTPWAILFNYCRLCIAHCYYTTNYLYNSFLPSQLVDIKDYAFFVGFDSP